MRTYAPADAATVLDRLLDEPSLARGVVHHEIIPARPAEFGDFPAWLDPRIVAGLGTRGVDRPYRPPGRGHRGRPCGRGRRHRHPDRVR